jgi:hypothetical protein
VYCGRCIAELSFAVMHLRCVAGAMRGDAGGPAPLHTEPTLCSC